MKTPTQKHYDARWYDAVSLCTRGSVSFFARNGAEAITKADRIGRDIGLPNSRRTIFQGQILVHDKQGGTQ